MSDAIDQMRKAQEDRFFKLEQEKHLMAYVVRIKSRVVASLSKLTTISFLLFFIPYCYRLYPLPPLSVIVAWVTRFSMINDKRLNQKNKNRLGPLPAIPPSLPHLLALRSQTADTSHLLNLPTSHPPSSHRRRHHEITTTKQNNKHPAHSPLNPPRNDKQQKKLKASGRYNKIPAPVLAPLSASALPQVLAHSMRMSQPMEEQVNRRQLDRNFMKRHVGRDPGFAGSLTLGSNVSLGKNKWAAGGAPDMNIFSVGKATEVVSQAPKHLDGVESRAAKHMVDTSFVEIRGTKLKLMPDPTPGRALAWGGTLAIWGTAAIVVGSCKVMNIHSMEDLRRVMNRRLTPLGESIKSTLVPLRTYFATYSTVGADGAAMNMKDTAFSVGVRNVFR